MGNPANTGATVPGAGARWRRAAIRLGAPATSASWGAPAARLNWSASPAFTPPSSGATSLSNTSSPRRWRTSEPTLWSADPVVADPTGRSEVAGDPIEVGGGPGDSGGGHDARRRQGVEVGGDTQHQTGGKSTQLTISQHQRRPGGGMYELVGDAEFGDTAPPPRAPGPKRRRRRSPAPRCRTARSDSAPDPLTPPAPPR